MSAETVLQWTIGFLVVWGLAVVAYAFWQATNPAWNPAAPEPIELRAGEPFRHDGPLPVRDLQALLG